MTFYDVLKMCAGLAMFLFGMSTMSKGLEKSAGSKLESILKKMTANPFISVAVGTVITAVIQSSSATTVMLVGLVNSGLMSFRSTVCVLFGANIGTTITSWLLSLSGLESSSVLVQMMKPQYFSPILAIIGTAFLMISKSDKRKTLGTIFVGFTVLIYGMDIMSDSVAGLADSPAFSELLLKFNNPVLGVLMGIGVTAIIQSSSASVGILQALSLTGSITFNMAVPIILGQNIGTCATGLISCIGADAKAKRVAVSQLLINVIGTLVFLPVYSLGTNLLGLSLGNEFVNPASIAVIHTLFNVVTVIVLMPFYKALAKLCEKLVKEKSEEAGAAKKPVYLDERILRSPSIAIMECDSYTVKMAHLAKETILNSIGILFNYNTDTAAGIEENETVLDLYEDELSSYLVKLSSRSLSNEENRKVSRMLHSIGDFERLGDHALNLKKTAQELFDKNIEFSDEAKREINVLIDAVSEIVITTAHIYEKNDVDGAKLVEPLEQVIDRLSAKIKSHHINRLQHGNCTIEMGFVLSDLITNCERISDHCSNIAVAIIEVQNDTFEAHQYLNSVKNDNEEFNKAYEQFKSKYSI